MIEDDPPHPVADVIAMVKSRKAEQARACARSGRTPAPTTGLRRSPHRGAPRLAWALPRPAAPPHPRHPSSHTPSPQHRQNLPDAEVVRVIWSCLMRAINMTGKNQSQILQAVVRAVKTYHKLLATFVVNGRLELTLLVTVQARAVLVGAFWGGGARGGLPRCGASRLPCPLCLALTTSTAV